MEEKQKDMNRMTRKNRPQEDIEKEAAPLEKRSRKERKMMRQAEQEASPKKTRWVQIRLFPIWLRIIVVAALIVGAAAAGAYVGFSVVGDGDPEVIFRKETWVHIVDIIKGVE